MVQAAELLESGASDAMTLRLVAQSIRRHLRMEAASAAELERQPVLLSPGLTPEQVEWLNGRIDKWSAALPAAQKGLAESASVARFLELEIMTLRQWLEQQQGGGEG